MSKYHLIVNGSPVPHEHDGRSVRFNDPKHWIVADEKHGFPAIVSKELFDLAQERRRSRNTPFTRGKAITAPYYLSGLAVCACGNHLQGHTKKNGKLKGYRKYHYYVCGGYAMKGRTVCERYLLPKELVEGPILAAFNRRIKAFGRVENIREQVKALLDEQATFRDEEENIRHRLNEIEEHHRHWQTAIDKGLDIEQGVSKLNDLAREKKALETDLAHARQRKSVHVSVEAVSREILGNLARLEQVLEAGSIAEVKAILRTYIGRIDVDPKNGKARIGFLRMPTRALVSEGVQSRTRISMVAGAGFEPATSGL
ncbi:MAG: recombinase zinc beta ribbon domain-containing protein [Planctomycetes bacterium]|nr:recombinase zinc beta ribbon domain-containing protein [Planctomycetota bacterium]